MMTDEENIFEGMKEALNGVKSYLENNDTSIVDDDTKMAIIDDLKKIKNLNNKESIFRQGNFLKIIKPLYDTIKNSDDEHKKTEISVEIIFIFSSYLINIDTDYSIIDIGIALSERVRTNPLAKINNTNIAVLYNRSLQKVLLHDIKSEIDHKLDTIKNCISDVKDKEETIIKIKDDIDKYQSTLKGIREEVNFIELEKAFKKQSDNAFYAKIGLMIMSAILAISPIIVIIFFQSQYIEAFLSESIKNIPPGSWEAFVFREGSMIPIVMILLYFFRLTHLQYKSAASVQLQYDHRQAICAFILGYAKRKPELGEASLSQFEAMAFSNVTPDPGNVPTAFDGIDGLTKLVEAIKR